MISDKKRYDVIVAGAGPAGICAAIESARSGASTLIVERYGCVGGNLTNGYVGPLLGSVCPGTMVEEIEAAICPEKGACPDFEMAKIKLTELLDDAGVDIRLQTYVTGAVREGKILTAAETSGKFGFERIGADVFIDATGDGDLAVAAGCPWKIGRSGDGLVQPVSLMFVIEGVDPKQTLLCHHEEHRTVMSNGTEYLDLCHRANRSGELPENVNIVRLYNTQYSGERMVNATQENYIDPLDPVSVSRSEVSLRRQIRQITDFLRNNVPGFEKITLKGSSATLGVRESRRIIGKHVLSAEEMSAGIKFTDTVVHNAHFCFDTHNPAGPGQSVHEEQCPPSPPPYDIPFSAMCPEGIINLLTAGRCISGTHKALSSYRVMRICMAMGQAAGAAAAIMAKTGVDSDTIDPSCIREHLMKRGVRLDL